MTTENRRRYNAGIQRAKGFLEMAAALYDGSLSYETTRAALGTLQTNTRVGWSLALSLKVRTAHRADGVSLSFSTGGLQALQAVADHRLSVLWANPSLALTMACRGTGPFTRPLPLKPIAVFPSYDVMGFAVHESTGITSLAEIKERRYPLRLSTGRSSRPPFQSDCTMFTVAAVLEAAGFTLADIRRWGGKIQTIPSPSHPDRRAAIEGGTVNAVFDEGIKSWGQAAVNHGFRFLPVDGRVLARMQALGCRQAVLPTAFFSGLPEDVKTVDFSGWPMVVHADMAEDVAYALCEAIDVRKEAIPTDNFKPLDMFQLCADDNEAPRDVPLHPGAERFYHEKAYLKK